MVYIVIKTWYPSHVTDKVNEKYLEMIQKFPPDNTLSEQVVPAAVKATKKGYEVMSIQLVKEGKFDETVARVGAALAMLRNIEGYEYSIEVWATLGEAQAMTA